LTSILVLACVLAAFSFAEAGATKIASTPVDGIIRLDGSATEWDGIPIISLRESLHVIWVARDHETLYLMFTFSDRGLAERLLRRGVILWFNGDGKTKMKKEEFALRYGGSEQIADHLASQGRDEAGDGDTRGRRGRGGRATGPPPCMANGSRAKPGELTIVTRGLEETVPENHADGPAAASMVAEEVFCCELRVPLSDIGGKIADRGPSGRVWRGPGQPKTKRVPGPGNTPLYHLPGPGTVFCQARL
jgi:hypothetical protein